MKFELGLSCRWLVSMAPDQPLVQENCFVGIQNGKIAVVEKLKATHKKACKKWIDGKNHVLMPGLVNGHAHLPMSLLRGAEDDADLQTWLFQRIFPLEAKFVNKNFVRLGTQLSALESIRFGITTTNDMYFYSSESAKIWDEAGLRGIFHQPFMDFPLPEDKDLGPDRWGRFHKNFKNYQNHRRIRFGLAPHAPYTCSDEILNDVARISEELKCPIHIHVSETAQEVQESMQKFGMSPVERLQKLKVLTPRTTCAHGIHLSAQDLKILKATGASVIHNPDSNSKLAAGICPVPILKQTGIPVGLGTDGVVSNNNLNLFGTMNLTAKMHKLNSGNPAVMKTHEVLHLATLGSARALGLHDQIGSLEVGKEADCLLVSMIHPHLQPANDVASHLVYACTGNEVETVVCSGRVLYHSGKHLTLNAKKILSNSEKFGKKVQTELRSMKSGK